MSAVLSAGMLISSAGCSLFGGSGASSSGNIGDITFADGDKIAVIDFKDYGTVRAKLFPDIAPVGVENFIKLAEQGYYDGLKIHRVIQDTYIQGGSLNGDGTGGTAAYVGEDAAANATTFPIEVSEKARNFYGALGYAADAYGNNSVQFYIVSNKTPTDTSKIDAAKVQAKADELAQKLAGESAAESATAEDSTAEAADTVSDDTKLLTYQQTYYSNNAAFIKKNGEAAAEKYKKVGGLYQIDGGYTVFGQVYEGFDVIDKINTVDVTTNASGEKSMPIQDVIISSVTIETYKASTAEATAEAGKSDKSGNKSTTAATTTAAPTASTAESQANSTAESVPVTSAESAAPATAESATATAETPSEASNVSNPSTAQAAATAEASASADSPSTVDTKEAA